MGLVFFLQVATSGNVNVIFVQQSPSDDIHMFLEGNEEILDGNLLFNLCSHPSYKMNVEAISRAVALRAVGTVFDACMNQHEMTLHWGEVFEDEDNDDEEQGGSDCLHPTPNWWLSREGDMVVGESQDSCTSNSSSNAEVDVGCSENLIPMVRLHPLHEHDNDKLCLECNTIFEEPGYYWPFLQQSNAAAFHGWVEFVVREGQKNGQRMEFLCIKLLEKKKKYI